MWMEVLPCPLMKGKQASGSFMLLYFPPSCNCTRGSATLMTRDRRRSAQRDTEREMRMTALGMFLRLMLKERKNVGFAWR
uniref:Uncharacterized protein n=1 Tax=Arundo donax TaxID=35708 RepID=A0A0A9E352_ARUDO